MPERGAGAVAARGIHPVLLSGGAGTRLWPLSRTLYPKQLLPLVDDVTMLQATAHRFSGAGYHAPLVICNEAHRFIIAEQLRAVGCPPAQCVLEPVGRNTAPAAAVAAMLAGASDAAALVLIAPSDHAIADADGLRAAIAAALPAAEGGALVTFGVQPSRPHDGYGYIRIGAPVEAGPCHVVDRFVEKPDLSTARRFLDEGGYVWNSGMFLFRADRYLEELARFAPDMLALCRAAVDAAEEDLDFLRLATEPFEQIAGDSIDYAVMQKTDRAAVMPIDVGWSDVGSWAALWEASGRDGDGNSVLGDVIAHRSRNCLVRSDGPLVATVGVEDLIVVATGDAVLVASKRDSEAVREVVAALAKAGRPEPDRHPRIVRPWGAFEGIKQGPGFQVKLLTVNPGAGISLQYHNHRAEHWVVVAGKANVTRGEETIPLTSNESVYIPLGAVHRLENPGSEPLEVVEVQTGDYLGEDDIVRLEDRYGRG